MVSSNESSKPYGRIRNFFFPKYLQATRTCVNMTSSCPSPIYSYTSCCENQDRLVKTEDEMKKKKTKNRPFSDHELTFEQMYSNECNLLSSCYLCDGQCVDSTLPCNSNAQVNITPVWVVAFAIIGGILFCAAVLGLILYCACRKKPTHETIVYQQVFTSPPVYGATTSTTQGVNSTMFQPPYAQHHNQQYH